MSTSLLNSVFYPSSRYFSSIATNERMSIAYGPAQVKAFNPITSRAGASGCRDSRRHLRSNRTRCTCSSRDHADAAALGHTRIHARSSSSRTTRNASHRPDAHEADPARRHTHVHNWTIHNVCTSYSYQYYTKPIRATTAKLASSVDMPTECIARTRLSNRIQQFVRTEVWRFAIN